MGSDKVTTVREPIKKTSIQKKETIIKKGFELMCEKGYHNVTTIDIAKYAGVSTGIIYQYFKDKRDIFINGVNTYIESIMFPMLEIISGKIDKETFKELLSRMIDKYIKLHNIKKEAHEELMAMSHLDEEISLIFKNKELLMTKRISEVLTESGVATKNLDEKVHIIIGIIDNYCHEVVYHKHNKLDYDKMKDIIINIVYDLIYG